MICVVLKTAYGMDTIARRKYPIGIQTFSEIRKGGYIYIDKTDLVWEMTQMKYVFLSRPRRFGKSLLSSTLHAYFDGRRDLFEGLKIMDLENEWESRPVFHLDLSVTKTETTVEGLRTVLFRLLEGYRKIYGEEAYETSPGGRFSGLIHRAYAQSGKQVAVIIDEYDAPLLDKLHDAEMLAAFRNVMQDFFVQLKSNEPMISFCFITGITKFSQLSIFSTINNLKNITMLPQYSTLCGITEDELLTDMAEDIRLMADAYECTPDEMHVKLKRQYDGYRFAEDSPEVYNPFSLMNAFGDKKIGNYWFSSGTPTFLIRQMRHFRTDITGMDRIETVASAFDRPTEAMENALPLLYQSGYLTIKDYDRETGSYILAIPNNEVKVGFVEGLLPVYVGVSGSDVQVGFAMKFWRALKKGDLELAMNEMKAYLAGIPYVEGFQKKLAEVKNYEGFYEYTFYLIFSMLNVYVRTQVKCANGETDVVVAMPDTTYIYELKVNGTAQDALAQINRKGYAAPYLTEGRKVVKAGIRFDRDTMTVGDYVVER